MRLTSKLIGYLHRVFDRDPKRVPALRIGYAGEMNWTVADGVLTTVISGGAGSALSIDLASYTIGELSVYIESQTGYSVTYTNDELIGRSSMAILDASGVPGTTDGDALYAYESVLWAWMDATALELTTAGASVDAMPAQMNITTANTDWLSEWGTRLSVPRLTGESDAYYAQRIINEVARLKANNKALEQIIEDQTGMVVEVVDIDWWQLPEMVNDKLGLTEVAPGVAPAGGWPYYGSPANNNPLNCAFAVLLGVPDVGQVDPVALATIKNIINRHRASGFLAKYFGPSGYFLRTNTLGEVVNNLVYLVGPKLPQYREIII